MRNFQVLIVSAVRPPYLVKYSPSPKKVPGGASTACNCSSNAGCWCSGTLAPRGTLSVDIAVLLFPSSLSASSAVVKHLFGILCSLRIRRRPHTAIYVLIDLRRRSIEPALEPTLYRSTGTTIPRNELNTTNK